MTISSDGKSATVEWPQNCNANGDAITGKDILSRVATGPRGSHAISSSWQISKRVNRSENALVVTLKLEGDTFSFADPSGQSYAAKLDGTETPFKGDLSNTMVSVKRDGKVAENTRFTVSADGKTITVSVENKVKGTTRQFVLRKL
jgi:hypothetical protein